MHRFNCHWIHCSSVPIDFSEQPKRNGFIHSRHLAVPCFNLEEIFFKENKEFNGYCNCSIAVLCNLCLFKKHPED